MEFTINILNVPYRVIIDSNELKKVCEEYDTDPDTISGIFLEQPAKILVASDIPHSLQVHALFHEILHAIGHTIGNKDLAEDELFVDALARALASVLESKQLLKFLMKNK